MTGKPDLAAGVLDQLPLFNIDLQGIGENIDGVKADLFRFMNALRGPHGGTQPG